MISRSRVTPSWGSVERSLDCGWCNEPDDTAALSPSDMITSYRSVRTLLRSLSFLALLYMCSGSWDVISARNKLAGNIATVVFAVTDTHVCTRSSMPCSTSTSPQNDGVLTWCSCSNARGLWHRANG